MVYKPRVNLSKHQIKHSSPQRSTTLHKMVLLIALCLVAGAISHETSLSHILQSPSATLKLYRDYKTEQQLNYESSEDRMRFRLFQKNAQLVAGGNSELGGTAEYELNFFSAMTEDEKKQWLGLNMTGHLPNTDISSSKLRAPKEKLWVTEGAVTKVKNQGSCGSCWSFAAVGGLETWYQQKSGKLRNFAEQEYLDCTYEGQKDGCNGGWPDNGYEYSAKKGGRLAATSDYPYKASDGACRSETVRNAAVSHKITGSVRVGSNELYNIQALADGSLSMAFEVTGKCQQYRSGILKDNTCTGAINHGVTGVGYTEQYVLVKNSWGSNWGDHGYVKFARNHGNCGLFEYSSYAQLEATGQTEEGGDDEATDYDPHGPTPAPTPAPPCKDRAINCKKEWCPQNQLIREYDCRKTCGTCEEEEEECSDKHQHCQADFCKYSDFSSDWCRKSCGHCEEKEPCKDSHQYCEKDFCNFPDFARDQCEKSCGFCEDSEDECAPGTVRCPDGVCRHEHMC